MIERLFPDKFIKSVDQIDINELKKRNIQGIILDIDNTIIDYSRTMRKEIKEWIESAKKSKLKIYLVSNNTKEKVNEIAEKIGAEYICKAAKPRRKGLLEAMRKMKILNTSIAVIGDQVFTDVYGGNRLNMFTILVEKVGERDIWITKVKRPLEKYVLKRYLQDNNKLEAKKKKWKEKSAFKKKIYFFSEKL